MEHKQEPTVRQLDEFELMSLKIVEREQKNLRHLSESNEKVRVLEAHNVELEQSLKVKAVELQQASQENQSLQRQLEENELQRMFQLKSLAIRNLDLEKKIESLSAAKPSKV